jgi:hypothetical protein
MLRQEPPPLASANPGPWTRYDYPTHATVHARMRGAPANPGPWTRYDTQREGRVGHLLLASANPGPWTRYDAADTRGSPSRQSGVSQSWPLDPLRPLRTRSAAMHAKWRQPILALRPATTRTATPAGRHRNDASANPGPRTRCDSTLTMTFVRFSSRQPILALGPAATAPLGTRWQQSRSSELCERFAFGEAAATIGESVPLRKPLNSKRLRSREHLPGFRRHLTSRVVKEHGIDPDRRNRR